MTVIERYTDEFCAGTHLSGIRGTAVGVEAVVMTWRICSRADKPPPTWKATWSTLFWDKERKGRSVKQRYCHGTMRRRRDGGLHGSHHRMSFSSPIQEQWIEICTKVIPKVFLFNLKSAQPDSTSEQSSINERQKLCRLQFAPGWSQWTTTD